MFSSPLNTRRNLSAVEISEMAHGGGVYDEAISMTHKKFDGKQHANITLLSQQNSVDVDTVSVGSSSVDWSPPESNLHSRRNTILEVQQSKLQVIKIYRL
jgi:hypothetical protein